MTLHGIVQLIISMNWLAIISMKKNGIGYNLMFITRHLLNKKIYISGWEKNTIFTFIGIG
jgi:hypothetical protein